MPELPEVETVCRGLNEILLESHSSIEKIETSNKKLREPFRHEALRKSYGQKIVRVIRRAKYLLFELEKNYLISHLGMTGSWRIEDREDSHDHVRIFLKDKRILTYRDPRRFGQFDIITKEALESDKRFSHLGPEPFSSEFNSNYLLKLSKKRKIPIKTLIMDQKVVVGVGNIYASEALFLAGIKPTRMSHTVKLREMNYLVEAIKETLDDAIVCGGSTISDFRQAGGSEGYFQNLFFVYGREKKECLFCKSYIVSKVIGGRNSFWCSSCQR